MKVLLVLVIALFSISKIFAKGREPAQGSPFPPPPIAADPTPSTTGGEDVFPGGAQLSAAAVYCITGSNQGYSLQVSGNDVRVSRVGSGNSYEVYKGQRFVGACHSVHVISRQ